MKLVSVTCAECGKPLGDDTLADNNEMVRAYRRYLNGRGALVLWSAVVRAVNAEQPNKHTKYTCVTAPDWRTRFTT